MIKVRQQGAGGPVLSSMDDGLGGESRGRWPTAHDTMVRSHVARRGDHVVTSQGDGFAAFSDGPTRAVAASLDRQRSFSGARSRLVRRTPISARVGMHCGPVLGPADAFFGPNVAIAADNTRFVLGRARTIGPKRIADLHTLSPAARTARRPGVEPRG